MRQFFRVIKAGTAVDDAGIEFYFPKEEGPVSGDIISAETIEQNLLTDIFVEQGPSAGREREEFESVGQEQPAGWNPNRGTPHKIAGTPHDGKFSHPMNHEVKLK